MKIKGYNFEKTTAKYMRDVCNRYCCSEYTTLKEAYKKPSYDKQITYNRCVKMFEELDGFDFRIIGHNTYTFSVGFKFRYKGQLYLAYITPTHDRIVPIFVA